MNLKSLDDWYGVTIKDFNDQRGAPLLRMFDYSLFKVLHSVYPGWSSSCSNRIDMNWKNFKSQTHVSKGFWNSKENRREYFDYLGGLSTFNKSKYRETWC